MRSFRFPLLFSRARLKAGVLYAKFLIKKSYLLFSTKVVLVLALFAAAVLGQEAFPPEEAELGPDPDFVPPEEFEERAASSAARSSFQQNPKQVHPFQSASEEIDRRKADQTLRLLIILFVILKLL